MPGRLPRYRPTASELLVSSGDDGTRTHDPLRARQGGSTTSARHSCCDQDKYGRRMPTNDAECRLLMARMWHDNGVSRAGGGLPVNDTARTLLVG